MTSWIQSTGDQEKKREYGTAGIEDQLRGEALKLSAGQEVTGAGPGKW